MTTFHGPDMPGALLTLCGDCGAIVPENWQNHHRNWHNELETLTVTCVRRED